MGALDPTHGQALDAAWAPGGAPATANSAADAIAVASATRRDPTLADAGLTDGEWSIDGIPGPRMGASSHAPARATKRFPHNINAAKPSD
jgi:hypothetical protein